MKFIDAYILARTKRKTRRIRMALVVIVSSLLFSVLFGAAFVVQGVINAGSQVADVGFNSRNLTTIHKLGNNSGFDYEAETKAIEDAMVAELKARGVKVDDLTKQDPSFSYEMSKRLNKLFAERDAEDQEKAEKQIRGMGKLTDIYHFASLPLSQLAYYQPEPDADPYVKLIEKELAVGDGAKRGFYGSSSDQLEFYSVEEGMLRTQVAPGQTLEWQPGQPYPVIISYNYLEKLGGTSLANLPVSERNAGYRDLISRFSGKEINYCYRNSTAQDQLRSVMIYNKEAEEDDDDSTKPINVPVCRGFDQKLLKDLEIISDEDPTGVKPLFPLPETPPPDTAVIKFKIAGFVPAVPEFGSRDVIVDMLVGISSLPTGPNPGIIPQSVVDKDSRFKAMINDSGAFPFGGVYLLADFANRADQKAFVDKGCSGVDCVGRGDDVFFIMPFGNVATALESVLKFVSKAILVAAAVVVVIAGLMIMLTISKVIADSTKEIAVFRSLGARRRDIAQIYYTYGFMLASSALGFSLALAVIGAWLATNTYGDRIAQGFVQAVGAYNVDVEVFLLGLNPIWLLGIVGALFLAAAIGIGIPVLASVRRKLINILREE